MKTFLLIFWLGGAVAFWVSFLIAMFEAAHRFKTSFPGVKVKKLSRASNLNSRIKLLVLGLLPIGNWYLAWCFTFQFDEIVTKVVLNMRKESADDL